MGHDPAQADPVPAGDGTPAHPLAVPVGTAVTAAFLVLDQATKELAERLLAPGRFVPLLGDHVGWELVYNPGGAFGVPAPSWVFVIVTVLVVALVVRVLPRTHSLLAASAYGLLLSGALGNILDRLLRPGDPNGGFADGWVIDFVAWGGFPRFNVADSAITVGFALLVLALLAEERAHRRGQHEPAEPPGEDGDGCGGADGPDGGSGPAPPAGRPPAGS